MSISRLHCDRRSVFSIALITLLFLTSTPRYQSSALFAQTQVYSNRIELHQALLDMANVWTVMCVAAHPDDEDGATLTILRRKYGVHTVSLFSTFGEGGQNAIGPELYEELGAIRAQETLKASEIQGSEPHFLGLKDFGFSKSAEEAFRIWGHQEALRRMVLQIRTLRPNVIITNHDTTSGHGHHQATGRLVLEAIDAAADPERFPEQFQLVKAFGPLTTWQVERLFVRMSSNAGGQDAGKPTEDTSANKIITINQNELDPIRGTTYAEQALTALQQHASQGPWPQRLPKEGWPPIRYRLARQANEKWPLPSNASTFLDGMELPGFIKRKLIMPPIQNHPLVEFIDEPERVFKAIASSRIKGIGFDDAVKANNDKRIGMIESGIDNVLTVASGISASLIPQDAVLIPGTPSIFVLRIENQGTNTATLESYFGGDAVSTGIVTKGLQIRPKSTWSEKISLPLSKDLVVSVPHALHLYDGRLFGEEFEIILELRIKGTRVYKPVRTRVDVAPVVDVESITPSPYIFTPANLSQPLAFRIRVKNNQNKPFRGQFGIASPTDHGTEVVAEIALAANETREFIIRSNVIPVDTPDERRVPRHDFGPIIIRVHPWDSAKVISEREIGVIYSDAHVVPNLRVGYVRSFDDTLRDSLVALGVESKELSIDDVRAGDLQSYDSIIIDNRGYQAHPELVAANSRLLDFAKNGGTLIVFYHKSNEWNADPAKNRPSLAPFPITLGNERVTDENATVTFTEPLQPLLNTPNKIAQEDFKDWIQERGLYYPKTWDPKYQSLFAMNDEGEAPLRGGLLVADYGKGHYIYTSMVWYRQLRAGVPGGYRMFANMISYGKTANEVK